METDRVIVEKRGHFKNSETYTYDEPTTYTTLLFYMSDL